MSKRFISQNLFQILSMHFYCSSCSFFIYSSRFVYKAERTIQTCRIKESKQYYMMMLIFVRKSFFVKKIRMLLVKIAFTCVKGIQFADSTRKKKCTSPNYNYIIYKSSTECARSLIIVTLVIRWSLRNFRGTWNLRSRVFRS